MRHRANTWSMAIAAAAAAVCSIELAGQSAARPELPGAAAHADIVARAAAKGYVPLKTPWGHPDIQGVFTTKDEANTPFERPDEWAGKRMEDITPQEFAAAVARRQEKAVEDAPFFAGEPERGIAIAVPIHWFDNLAAQNSRPWFVVDPPEGKVPPLVPGAEAHRTRNPAFLTPDRGTYLDRNLADRCLSFAFRMPGIYGNSYQILQTPEHVVFRREQLHDARVIPLTGRPLSTIPAWEGHSRAHWEGNTLVVEATGFDERVPYRGYSAKNLRIVERFTRTAANKVEWSMTIDNPTVYARPWTFSYPLTEDDTQLIHEYACHEGNYGMANLLTAGRAMEKK